MLSGPARKLNINKIINVLIGAQERERQRKRRARVSRVKTVKQPQVG